MVIIIVLLVPLVKSIVAFKETIEGLKYSNEQVAAIAKDFELEERKDIKIYNPEKTNKERRVEEEREKLNLVFFQTLGKGNVKLNEEIAEIEETVQTEANKEFDAEMIKLQTKKATYVSACKNEIRQSFI